jgi:hypothetical protein
MLLERAVTEPREFSLLSHAGLSEEGTVLGGGPVTALFRKDGILSGATFAVSGGHFYAAGTSEGLVAGAVTPSIAGNEIGVAATAGADAVFWDGTTYSTADFPLGNVRKIIQQGGRFIGLIDGTGTFGWTEILSDALVGGILTFDALNFATAESEPDSLVDAVALQDRIVLGGKNTIEFWVKTGDSDLPYTPISGLVFQKGVRDTGCMAPFDNSVAWISEENIVYRAGNVPERISDAGIEELIAASAECRVDSYFFEGHELLKVLLDTVCIEYDAQTGTWAERKTGTGRFQGGPVIPGPVFGSTANGKLLAPTGYTDLGSYHERSFCLGFPLNGGSVKVKNLRIRTNPGQTEFLEGDYTDPAVELFLSRDGGITFDDPLPETLGGAGQYRREVEWRALGLADPPGFFGKVRVTDPVSFRCSGGVINEPHGGRSR